MITVLAALLLSPIPTTVPVTPPGFDAAVEPQAAVADDGTVYVAFGMGKTLYCSSSHDRGATYGPPVKVAQPGEISLGMRRGPRVAIVRNTVVISAVFGAQGKGRDGDLAAWRSTDGGKTWSGPAIVNDVPGSAREGLHAMASGTTNQIACTWLDLRVKGTTIYEATSSDGGATWSRNYLVYASPDGTVCQCCHPSAAYGPDGTLYVMWRNVLAGDRDLFVASSADNKKFRPAQKLGLGSWPLNACPMDGGGLAIDGMSMITVWRRDKTVYRCVGNAPETDLGIGEQPWASGPYAVWLDRRGGPVRLLDAAAQTIELASAGDDPVIAAGLHGPVIAAWASPGNGIRSAVVKG